MRDELNDALSGLRQVHGRMVQKLMANPDYRAMLTVESSISALSGLLTQASHAPAPAPVQPQPIAAAPAPIALAMITPEVERSIEASIEEEVSGNVLQHTAPKAAAMPFVPRQHSGGAPLARHIGA